MGRLTLQEVAQRERANRCGSLTTSERESPSEMGEGMTTRWRVMERRLTLGPLRVHLSIVIDGSRSVALSLSARTQGRLLALGISTYSVSPSNAGTGPVRSSARPSRTGRVSGG
jgi:hypothetical protein